MFWKIILIILIVLFGLIVFVPLILRFVGVDIGGGLGTVGVTAPELRGLVLRSRDGGASWEGVEFESRRGFPAPGRIFDMAFHPQNPDIIFAGTKGAGLWKSENGGVTWRPMGDLGALTGRSDILRLAIHPADPNLMYAASFSDRRGRVLRSEDGGATFREVYQVTRDGFGVFDLYLSPANPEAVVIVTGEGGVLASRNGGKEWRVLKWFGEQLSAVRVNPAFEQEMYVLSARGKLFKTSDGGLQWTDLTAVISRAASGGRPPAGGGGFDFSFRLFGGGGAAGRGVSEFSVDPVQFTTVYAAFGSALVRSQNAGLTWEALVTPLPPSALPVRAIAVDRQDSRSVTVGAANHLYRSEDGGVAWRETTIPAEVEIQELVIHPERLQTIFAFISL